MSEHDPYPPPDEPPSDERGGRVPPQDSDAEMSVLGAMMLSRQAIEDVVPLLSPPDFYRPTHEEIYDSILDLYGAGVPVDVLTVAQHLTERGRLAQVGGAVFLHDLTSRVQVALNAPHYAKMVAEAAHFRRMIEAGTKIVQRGFARMGASSTAYDASMADLMAANTSKDSQDYVVAGDLLDETVEALDTYNGTGEMRGVPTGFYDLDELTQGLQGGQMVVVAGRPAMGKSTLALDFARSASIRHGLTSVFFSLEMPRQEIMMRMISAECRIALNKIRGGLLGEDDWTRLGGQYESMAKAPLYIDDSPNLTITEIRAKARRLKQQHDLRLVTVDYMQLLEGTGRPSERQGEVAAFSRQMKLMAKELDVAVVALSQLNRGVEQRAVKRPMLSDLRESGAIEQDADIVILVHREDMYEVESTRPGEADLIVAKHRNGPTRDVTVVAQLHYSKFVDMAQ